MQPRKRIRPWRMLIGLIALGALALLWAQAAEEATYVGTKKCELCHKLRADSKAIVAAYPQTAHARALQEASVQGAIVADMAAAPMAPADIKYVLCGSRRFQSYIDHNLKVMAQRWNVAEKKWEADPEAGKDAATQCLGCHTTGYNPATQEFVQAGVGCEMCHGPGSVHSAKLGKEPMVKPEELDPQRQAMICGQCHSVGHSKDGSCAFPVGFRPGNNLADFFVDSGTRKAVRNSQYTHLLQSPKHLEKGTICTTCHDPHGQTDQPHQLKKTVTELCLACHSGTVRDIASHAAEKQMAAPADATCATCHMKDGVHLFDKAVAGS